MNSKDAYIPQSLDEPTRYLVFTADELMVIILPLVVCTVTLNFVIGLVAGLSLLWLLRKFKQGSSLHRLLWAAYYALPSYIFRFKATPPSHLRELAG
ncbi:type IV conjugative transfer system protein TraL [Caulobacter sp. 17J65-9]|uniref:type IV conjugative transfer system protein TraL n=1 Tax=Caulobacter sp. 17J65-9 TaxID=2709382 RepID=UPI0013CA076A|nr:type IV conjugative transfer system protein TraL [Caulobacter sp. 17J65-9]NEX91220.1 type IV conjugative transfer system protein TraL [Caulobacter sp. 17J65-9]